jgi:hypothetical protein
MSDINVEISTQTIECEITGITNFPTATEDNSVIVSSGTTWIARTIAQLKTILGLGSAAYTDSTAYATAVHGHTASQVTAVAFSVVTFANPLNLDATTNKDFQSTITGDTVINLNNAIDGDAGMVNLLVTGAGGYNVTLGTMFTQKLGTTSLDLTTGKNNYISYRKVGTDIVYTINQVET